MNARSIVVVTFIGSVLGAVFTIMLVGNANDWTFFVVAALMPCAIGLVLAASVIAVRRSRH
jgi:hypothetical protein